MKKIVQLIPAAMLSVMTPALLISTSVQAAESQTIQQVQQQLDGYWVDVSGRGVLTLKEGIAWFSVDGEMNQQDRYQVELNNQQLQLTPADGSKDTNKPIAATVENQTINLKKGIYQYQFVPAPQITGDVLDGYWRSENLDNRNLKNIRALHYKNNATVYDYYWWRINQGYGTYQSHIDKNVALLIKHGFILTAPGADNRFLVYAVKHDGDVVHYVSSSGDKWVETRTDELHEYAPPKGFRQIVDWKKQ